MTEHEKLDLIIGKLITLEARIDSVETNLNRRIDSVETNLNHRIDSVETNLNHRIDSVETNLNHRIDSVETRLSHDISEVKDRVTTIEMTLENRIHKNIQIIAENHLDLTRKLDEALKVENEKEMALIRLNNLEDEVRKITKRLDKYPA